MSYGIFDTKDQVWMGSSNGLLRLEEHMLARAAATIINEQFGETVRFRARKIPAWMMFVQKDAMEPKITAEEAVRRIEDRA